MKAGIYYFDSLILIARIFNLEYFLWKWISHVIYIRKTISSEKLNKEGCNSLLKISRTSFISRACLIVFKWNRLIYLNSPSHGFSAFYLVTDWIIHFLALAYKRNFQAATIIYSISFDKKVNREIIGISL